MSEVNGGLGQSFTIEEIAEYGVALKNTVMLSDDALAGVAGGVAGGDMEENFVITITAAGVTAAGKFLAGAGGFMGGAGVLIGAIRN